MPTKKDVNPQAFRMQVTESAANTFTEQAHSTPNIAESGLVMELLKVQIEVFQNALAEGDQVQVAIYDRPLTSIPRLGDPGVIAKFNQYTKLTTSGAESMVTPVEFDLSDGGGNGWLYGKKSLYIAVVGTSQSDPMIADAVILYRLKKVTSVELVGLVQD